MYVCVVRNKVLRQMELGAYQSVNVTGGKSIKCVVATVLLIIWSLTQEHFRGAIVLQVKICHCM